MNTKKYFILKNYINFFKNRIRRYQISYSQCGEDIIISYLCSLLKIAKPSYIEIGTNHPKVLNNTYLFYKKGSRGLCIEPDPKIFRKIKKERPRDEHLNVGIGAKANNLAKYYIMSSNVLSTFSKYEAEKYVADKNYGVQKIEKILDIQIIPVNDLLERYLEKYGDIISIDTEGWDSEIVHAINFGKYRPKIICVETARCANNNTMSKDDELIQYLKNNEYFLYADTHLNSIFVDKLIWIF